MKEQKNIDEIFKEAFDQFEVDPGADVWAKVQTGLNSGSAATSSAGAAGSTASTSWVATAIVGLAISAIAVGGYYFFNQKGKAKVEAAIEANEKSINDNQPINTKSTNQSVEDAAVVAPENADNNAASDKNGASTQQSATQQNTEIKSPKDQADPVRQLSNSSKSNSNSNNSKDEVIDQSKVEASENLTESSSESSIAADKGAPIVDESNATDQSTYQEVESSTSEKSDDSSPSKIIAPATMDSEEKITIHIEFPTAFTPDQDGTNDKFIIIKELSKGLDKVEEASMQISNNTGKTVAVWKGVNGSWDGRLPDGSNAPKGNYLYQFIYTIDGQAQTPLNGLIFLNR